MSPTLNNEVTLVRPCVYCRHPDPTCQSSSGRWYHPDCLSAARGHLFVGPRCRPLTRIEFLSRLSPLQRTRKSVGNVAVLAVPRRDGDHTYYADILREIRGVLPEWRKLPEGRREVQDRYVAPILDRTYSAGPYGGRLTLRDAIARRRAREAAAAAATKATRKEQAVAACRARFGKDLPRFAALMRRASSGYDRKRAMGFWGSARLSPELPRLVNEEIARQSRLALGRYRARSNCVAAFDRRLVVWKQARIEELVAPILRSSSYYHTTTSSLGNAHRVIVELGEVAALGGVCEGEWHKYGRMGYRRQAGDWEARITVPVDWWSRVRPLGVTYDARLVLDAEPLGNDEYRVTVLVQGRARPSARKPSPDFRDELGVGRDVGNAQRLIG